MTKQALINDYAFEGVLAEHCANFVAEKRAVGYTYNTEAKHMCRFSRFSTDFEIPKDTLPEEVVHAWIERQPTDSDRNYYSRFALIKLFAEYMQRLGYEAYCPSKDDLGKIQWTYIPYIFTHDEIRSFLPPPMR